MAEKKYVVHLNLNKNQLFQAAMQNLGTAPTSPVNGQFYWDTTDNTAYIYDTSGTPGWRDLLAGGGYTHPTFTAFNPDMSGANVLASITTNTEGHITAITTRALAASDIGAAVVNDSVQNSVNVWTGDKVISEINNAVQGGTSLKGNYDAATNTPNLDSAPSAGTIFQGDMYVVSVADTFFTEDVSVGDTLIAKVDDPTALSDWIRIEKNIQDISAADESTAGLMRFATEAEVLAGAINTAAVSPQYLKSYFDANGILRNTTLIGDGAALSYTVTHNFNTKDVMVQLFEGDTPIEAEWSTPTVNTVDLNFNEAPLTDAYKVVIKY